MLRLTQSPPLFCPLAVHQYCREPSGRPEDFLLTSLSGRSIDRQEGFSQRCHRGWTPDGQELYQDLPQR